MKSLWVLRLVVRSKKTCLHPELLIKTVTHPPLLFFWICVGSALPSAGIYLELSWKSERVLGLKTQRGLRAGGTSFDPPPVNQCHQRLLCLVGLKNLCVTSLDTVVEKGVITDKPSHDDDGFKTLVSCVKLVTVGNWSDASLLIPSAALLCFKWSKSVCWILVTSHKHKLWGSRKILFSKLQSLGDKLPMIIQRLIDW